MIANLVLAAAEAIIPEEQVSWTSTAAAKQGLAAHGSYQQGGGKDNNEAY